MILGGSMKNDKQKIRFAHIGLIILSLTMLGTFLIINLHWLSKLLLSGLNIIGAYGLLLLFLILFEIGLYLMIYRIAKQVAEHQKPFDFLKRREPLDERQMILVGLKSLPYSYPMKQVNNGIDVQIQDQLIAIRILKGKGLLNGRLQDTEWTLDGKKINNPFPNNAICYLLKEANILYQVEDVFVGSISQITFKIENKFLNLNK